MSLVIGEDVNRIMELRQRINSDKWLKVINLFKKILIVLALEDLMVETEAMEEFKIQIRIANFNANRHFQNLIILEKKQHSKDLVVQVGTSSNKKVEKVEALSG